MAKRLTWLDVLVYAIFRLWVGLLRSVSWEQAQNLCAWTARRLARSRLMRRRRRVALNNLQRVFPSVALDQQEKWLDDMFGHLGRTIADYAHLHTVRIFPTNSRDREQALLAPQFISADQRFEVEGLKHLRDLLAQGGPSVIFTGHLGSWEMVAVALAQAGFPVSQVYRSASNPLIDRIIRSAQASFGAELLHRQHALRGMMHALERGRHVILLSDQRTRTGVVLPFLGHPALTPVGAAKFALRFQCPVLPAYAVRTSERGKPSKIRIVFEPPLDWPTATSKEDATHALLAAMNDRLSTWIQAYPDQWLWIHDRWRAH